MGKSNSAAKRKTLKTLLGGTGAVVGATSLPEKWTKPLVSSVILPAHAETTAIVRDQLCNPDTAFSINEVIVNGTDTVTFNLGANAPVVGEADVEVIIEYNTAEAETDVSDTLESELGVLTTGTTFELDQEIALAGQLNTNNLLNIVCNFEYCGSDYEVDWE